MTKRARTASALLLAGVFLLAGCATTPGGAGAPGGTAAPGAAAPGGESELDAAWLADGASIGVVTYGSSGCLPVVGEVSAAGQTVTVDLTDPEGAVCTKDYVPRGSVVLLPAGVDAAQDVEIVVTGTYAGDIDLDGLRSEVAPPASDDADPLADMEASAGWFGDGGIVLLTYGSSSCPPVFETVELATASEVRAVVATPPADQVCTADFAPRASILQVEGVDDDAQPTELVLTGADVEDQRVRILR